MKNIVLFFCFFIVTKILAASPNETCNQMQARGWVHAVECRTLIKMGHYFTAEAVDLCTEIVEKGWSGYGNYCLKTIMNRKYTLAELSTCKRYIDEGASGYVISCFKNLGIEVQVPTVIEKAKP